MNFSSFTRKSNLKCQDVGVDTFRSYHRTLVVVIIYYDIECVVFESIDD